LTLDCRCMRSKSDGTIVDSYATLLVVDAHVAALIALRRRKRRRRRIKEGRRGRIRYPKAIFTTVFGTRKCKGVL
jgi:hypothetical protein